MLYMLWWRYRAARSASLESAAQNIQKVRTPESNEIGWYCNENRIIPPVRPEGFSFKFYTELQTLNEIIKLILNIQSNRSIRHENFSY